MQLTRWRQRLPVKRWFVVGWSFPWGPHGLWFRRRGWQDESLLWIAPRRQALHWRLKGSFDLDWQIQSLPMLTLTILWSCLMLFCPKLRLVQPPMKTSRFTFGLKQALVINHYHPPPRRQTHQNLFQYLIFKPKKGFNKLVTSLSTSLYVLQI